MIEMYMDVSEEPAVSITLVKEYVGIGIFYQKTYS